MPAGPGGRLGHSRPAWEIERGAESVRLAVAGVRSTRRESHKEPFAFLQQRLPGQRTILPQLGESRVSTVQILVTLPTGMKWWGAR